MFCSVVPLISMLDMESHHIPQACLNYAYLLFGKGAFRETLHIRGKGTSGESKILILYSQKSRLLSALCPKMQGFDWLLCQPINFYLPLSFLFLLTTWCHTNTAPTQAKILHNIYIVNTLNTLCIHYVFSLVIWLKDYRELFLFWFS